MVSTFIYMSSRFIHTVADGIEVGQQPPSQDGGGGGGGDGGGDGGDGDDCFEDEESFFGSLFCSLKQ